MWADLPMSRWKDDRAIVQLEDLQVLYEALLSCRISSGFSKANIGLYEGKYRFNNLKGIV